MGQEEEALPPAAVAFSWEHDRGVLTIEGRGMPGSLKKAPATVFLSWENDPAAAKPTVKPRGVPENPSKAPAPARLLSVPPPPGRPAARGVSRAVRPEDDPFLAAYLACTKSTGRGDGGKKRTSGAPEPEKGQRRFSWGLGRLSCKRDDGAVVQSMVKVAKLPEVDPRDA
ncbi:uncharacterized protein [Lolium perenne]|jgi:hypothetical protein|uniref:uncharacterized protein n=1 Tax=Lolium perenne TaxID=4522 RepID=UPI0021F52CE8|nr:uncharacterized protein LOC127336028 [Lolium perenne]